MYHSIIQKNDLLGHLRSVAVRGARSKLHVGVPPVNQSYGRACKHIVVDSMRYECLKLFYRWIIEALILNTYLRSLMVQIAQRLINMHERRHGVIEGVANRNFKDLCCFRQWHQRSLPFSVYTVCLVYYGIPPYTNIYTVPKSIGKVSYRTKNCGIPKIQYFR